MSATGALSSYSSVSAHEDREVGMDAVAIPAGPGGADRALLEERVARAQETALDDLVGSRDHLPDLEAHEADHLHGVAAGAVEGVLALDHREADDPGVLVAVEGRVAVAARGVGVALLLPPLHARLDCGDRARLAAVADVDREEGFDLLL